ncbi:MAG: DUF4136 domain-containing protein [Acidobacteria bacterium]|nr:DUF4136 domain-containing protein [Acidobacteriota bacterium]
MRLLLLGLLLPCLLLADRAESDFDPETDFSRFHTFSLRRGTIRTKKPEINNDIIHRKVEAAIRAQLTAKGLTEVESKPDLGIVWSLGASDRREVVRTPAGRRGWRTRVDAHRFTEGTLIIDLHEASSRELVYRATYVDDESNAGKLAQKLERDAQKALEKFPPKKK